jgi:hypothetical protein
MRRINISEAVIDALKPLAHLTPSTFESVVCELEQSLPYKLVLDDDIEKIVLSNVLLSDLDDDAKVAVTEAIGGAHALLQSANTTVNHLISEISRAYSEELAEDGESPQAGEVEIHNLQNNLRLILRIRQLFASTKALGLLNDHDRLFIKSRIITEVRPIFEEDIALPIVGSVMLHSLKLTLRSNGKNENHFVALDSMDLLELKGVIDRAIAKSQAIERSLSSSGGNFGKLIEVNNGDE